MPETEYVFKSTGRNRLGRANSQILRRRLKAMAEWYGNPFLNITNIWNSGAVEYGKQLMQKYNIDTLEIKHYEMICEKYGMNPVRAPYIRQSIGEYVDGAWD